MPTTVINFVEGSRFTPDKHRQRQSPYQYLLPPKAGGIAFTLAAMGELFTSILDVTIVYPNIKGSAMLAMLGGKLTKIVLRVKVLEIKEGTVGDYFNNESFRAEFQAWLNQVWLEKDKLICDLEDKPSES